jgi:polyhydroxyalkanoate synthase
VATTEGAVVFENELFQLIEYKPLTAKVYERPFLLVPPCINKFYILDLQPENSLIRYAVEQGHRTFVVSWRNPDESMATRPGTTTSKTPPSRPSRWCTQRSPAPRPSTRWASASAAPSWHRAGRAGRARRKTRGQRHLLTTLIDFTDTGILDVFIDEAFVKYREMQMGKGGLMKGRTWPPPSASCAPTTWSGTTWWATTSRAKRHPPFDLLYWNSDSTNLPGPFYAWYLRNTYLENNLVKPGKARCVRREDRLGKVDIPVYIYGSREDHIVPIGGAYASTQHCPARSALSWAPPATLPA